MKAIIILYILLYVSNSLHSQALEIESSSSERKNNEIQTPNEKKTENNTSKKWEFFLGSNVFASNLYKEKGNGLNLGIYYKLNSKISFGYSHYHYIDTPDSNFHMTIFPTTFTNKKFDKSKEIGIFNFRYFLSSEIPFFLIMGIARDFIGTNASITQFGFFNRAGFTPYPTITKSDVSSNYSISGGIGFQKNYENGFLFGFSYIRMQSLDARRNLHPEFYSESINTQDILISIVQNELGSHHITINRGIFSFWVGYAF